MSRQYAVLDAGKTSAGEVRRLTISRPNDRLLIHLAYHTVNTRSQGQEVAGQSEEASSTCVGAVYSTGRIEATISMSFLFTETVAFVVPSHDTTTTLWNVSRETETTMFGQPSWTPRRETILSPSATPISGAFEREKQAFLNMRANLLSNPDYHGKFIAVLNGEIVDYDENEAELARRCYKKHGYVPMYMTKVDRTERVLEMSSPE